MKIGSLGIAIICSISSILVFAHQSKATLDEAPITSVTQLTDVYPTDWAFIALQSLVERYGCIAGYPNKIFQGNRSLSRYEFAASLNTCLNRINELVTTATNNIVRREDLVTLQQLQAQFASELETLRGRVDTLEASNAELSAHQFSTTTKLNGQVIFGVSAGAFDGERIIDATGREITRSQPNTTVFYRVSLDFDTSFNGTDLLKLRIDTLSGRGRDNIAGYLEQNFGSALEYTTRGTPATDPGISRAYYSFTPVANLNITLGPAIVTTDYIDKNSYAYNFTDFSTLAFVNNYILFPVVAPSAGAVIDWNPSGAFKLRALYVAADGANPNSNSQQPVTSVSPFINVLYPNGNSNGDRGLFGNPNLGIVELEYSPSKAFAVRLQYSGGNMFNNRFDVFGANVELALSQSIGVFGRYGYGSYNNTAFGDINPNYWMAGIHFRDLFIKQALAGIAVGQPFIEGAVGNATQTNFEAFYNYPVNDNVRLTPLIQVITNPANQESNGTIVSGSVRTIFSF